MTGASAIPVAGPPRGPPHLRQDCLVTVEESKPQHELQRLEALPGKHCAGSSSQIAPDHPDSRDSCWRAVCFDPRDPTGVHFIDPPETQAVHRDVTVRAVDGMCGV